MRESIEAAVMTGVLAGLITYMAGCWFVIMGDRPAVVMGYDGRWIAAERRAHPELTPRALNHPTRVWR